jgi:pimeloyl-ACP methyl ester carboxylesterase
MTTPTDVQLTDGRVLRVYDTGGGDPGGADAPGHARDTGHAGATGHGGGPTLLWHHGSPQTGALLEPLVSAAAERGIRLVSYARPSYGGSSPNVGRDAASAAGDVAQIADSLGLTRFAVMGASGGGPHALACAALLPDRIVGAVCLAGIAPYTADYDWFAGMTSPGGLRAAMSGGAERARYAESEVFDRNVFTAADWAALGGAWSSVGDDSVRAGAAGPDGLIDDDVAFAKPWGFDVGRITAPVLLVQGGEDRVVPAAHAEWLHHAIGSSELWLRPRDGHVSVLDAVPAAMDWLLSLAGRR